MINKKVCYLMKRFNVLLVGAAFLAAGLVHAQTSEKMPKFFNLALGMSSKQAMEVLKKNKKVQPPTLKKNSKKIKGKPVDLVFIRTKATEVQQQKWEGVRSVSLMFHEDQLLEIEIFVYEDGGEPFKTGIKKLSSTLEADVSEGQHFVKGYLIKNASNKLYIMDMNSAVKTGFLPAEYIKQLEAAFAKRKK